VIRDSVVVRKQPAIDKLCNRDGGDRFDGRHPKVDRVRRHRDARSRFAEREVGERFTISGNIHLRARVKTLGDSRF
jgi:hypothetical protein